MDWDLTNAEAECRLEAAEFQRRARKAWFPSNRRLYLETAERFLRLAEGYERHRNLKQNRLRELRAQQKDYAAAQ